MTRRILCLLLSSISFQLASQKLNLDFEKLSAEGVYRPKAWTVNAYAQNVKFICDSTTRKSGKYALKVYSEKEADSNTFELAFFIEPSQILNKQILLRGWAITEDFEGEAGLTLESSGEYNESYSMIAKTKLDIGTVKNWTQFKTALTIPENSVSLIVKIHFQGQGTVWFDHLELAIDRKLVKEVTVAPLFSTKQLLSIHDNSKPFKTYEPTTESDLKPSQFEDLAFFKEIVGESKVIALGESTHGTSEFFKVKHRLLQYSALELGVRVFILEDNQLLVERINKFVCTGEGEAERVMKGLFAVWNTREMLQLIKWVRAYNVQHPKDMIEFVGMDVQNPKLALEHLEAFLSKKDKDLYAKSKITLAPIRKNWSQSYFQPLDTLQLWHRKAIENYRYFERRKAQWLRQASNQADSLEIEWAVNNANTIKQFTATALGGVYEGRDKAMADKVDWIINQRGKDTKVLIWAHDSHIARGDAPIPSANYFFGKSMGSYLSKKYGEDYKAFGLFTYQGTCLGTISYSNFRQLPFTIYSSPRGTLDEGLHLLSQKTRQPLLMTNLRPFKNDLEEFAWLNIKRPVRYVGYVAEDYGFGGRYRIPYQFDGIIFIDTSSATEKPD